MPIFFACAARTLFSHYLYPFAIGAGIVAIAVHSFSISAWQIVLACIRGVEFELDILSLFGFERQVEIRTVVAEIGVVYIAIAAALIVIGKAGIYNFPT